MSPFRLLRSIFHSQTTKVIISGIPQHANFSDVEPLLKQYGTVEECDAVASKDPKTQTVHITFETYEQAQRWETKTFGVDWITELH